MPIVWRATERPPEGQATTQRRAGLPPPSKAAELVLFVRPRHREALPPSRSAAVLRRHDDDEGVEADAEGAGDAEDADAEGVEGAGGEAR